MADRQHIDNQSADNKHSGPQNASDMESGTRNSRGALGIQGKYATHNVRGAHSANQNANAAPDAHNASHVKSQDGSQKSQNAGQHTQSDPDSSTSASASSVVMFDFALNEKMRTERLEKTYTSKSQHASPNIPESPQGSHELPNIGQDDAPKPENPDGINDKGGNKGHSKAGHENTGKGSKDAGKAKPKHLSPTGKGASNKAPNATGKAVSNKAPNTTVKHLATVPNIFQLSNGAGATKQKGSKGLFWIAAGAIACVAIAIIIISTISTRPINVTINGQELSLSGDKTIEASVNAANVPYNPGNLIAVDGSVIEQGGGNPFSATVNGSQAQANDVLNDGDTVIINDGTDIEEESYTEERDVAPNAVVDGVGAVHKIEAIGENGSQLVKIGTVSGKEVAVEVLREPTDTKVSRFNIDTGGEKVIALTFDDGPSSDYTNSVLDILAQNNAKATFFTIGNRITDSTKALVERAFNEGHQVSTHSYDHADGSGQGVNLGYMSDEEQVAEITKGYESIENATGVECSKAIRTPGGNFGENVIANLAPYITYEIGWNIDTNDWQRPGASVIEERILKAGPGDIILMHDGGGNRAQTVDALRAALPKLAAQGYRFITVDELIGYAD